MRLLGQQLIGLDQSAQGASRFWASNPSTGKRLEPAFVEATTDEIDRALKLAVKARLKILSLSRADRATLLENIANQLEGLGDNLLERTQDETGLPLARLEGERARTCSQLRLFAQVVREGGYLDARIDNAEPDRTPLPKPDVRQMKTPVGPVAVFGASNFPLAFSVAGGDTASALAAGCPVIVKAHPNHPGASEMAARAVIAAVEESGFPEGTFSMVHGSGHEVSIALVRHPSTRAVGFTGSLQGGRALFDAAVTRDRPIPVFAEMGSVNPVLLLPTAIEANGSQIAAGLAASVTLGAGQFCTNPGLLILLGGESTEEFLSELAAKLNAIEPATMLHSGICSAYYSGLSKLSHTEGVTVLAGSEDSSGSDCVGRPALLETSGSNFLNRPSLAEEVFGPSTLAVVCQGEYQLYEVIRQLSGQLTGTVHATGHDLASYPEALPLLEERVGRLVYGGYPTGVEVCHAMFHGGPYPASTDPRFTSVGTSAIRRFLRPVCYQDFPSELLPEELMDGNPAGIPRLVDGTITRD